MNKDICRTGGPKMMKYVKTLKAILLVVITIGGHTLGMQAQATDNLRIDISGKAKITQNGPISLTIEQFEELAPTTHVITSTPWHPQTDFSGISGANLVRVLGVEGQTLRLTALNDYTVEISVMEMVNSGLILATRMDGELLTVKNKGPIFLVYPFDSNPEKYRTEEHFGRSIWQVVDRKSTRLNSSHIRNSYAVCCLKKKKNIKKKKHIQRRTRNETQCST